MASLTIVALPSADDYVNKISSEKIPHMTLLFLGDDVSKVKNLSKIIEFVEHAANTSLKRFYLDVDRRGELGPNKADVLFFSKIKWSGFPDVNSYRANLLKEPNIKTAYDSIEQFPEWIPHLTLGYPETPAKPDTRDYPGFSSVSFDRIAVWVDEYEGIEFPLKSYDMSLTMSEISKKTAFDVLSHFGVKGMKWGVRRNRSSSVTVSDKGKKLKTSGGYKRSAHPDAVAARTLGQVGKSSGLKALSNQELQTYAHRLQLEQNVKRLNYNELSAPKRFVASLLGRQGSQLAGEAAKTGTAKAGRGALNAATRKSIRLARVAART